jgi:hypothetical protein
MSLLGSRLVLNSCLEIGVMALCQCSTKSPGEGAIRLRSKGDPMVVGFGWLSVLPVGCDGYRHPTKVSIPHQLVLSGHV